MGALQAVVVVVGGGVLVVVAAVVVFANVARQELVGKLRI